MNLSYNINCTFYNVVIPNFAIIEDDLNLSMSANTPYKNHVKRNLRSLKTNL